VAVLTGCPIKIWTTLWGCFLKVNKEYFLWHQAWPHNDLLLLKTEVQYLWHTYLWPPIPWHRKAMDKEIIKAMATKFSEIFTIKMLKKYRKFCRLDSFGCHTHFSKIVQIPLGHPVCIISYDDTIGYYIIQTKDKILRTI
jgi:hypothetical protein